MNKQTPDIQGENEDAEHRGIQDVARELGVTHRTLRFYEDSGLISPARVGTTRIYSKRDVGRIQLILRGKRLGFSIREIKEFLDLYDADPDHREQMELLLGRVRQRLAELKKQMEAIRETTAELRQIEHDTVAWIENSHNHSAD